MNHNKQTNLAGQDNHKAAENLDEVQEQVNTVPGKTKVIFQQVNTVPGKTKVIF